jgi:glucokinase
MTDFSIGVDLGGTNLRIAAVSREGTMLEKITLSTKTSLGPDYVITEMCDAILQLSGKYKSSGQFLGTGLGIPGILDLQSGTIRKSANLPGFTGYPVRAEVERRVGARPVLENDGKVAALGEQWLGAARGMENVAMITLGTGIGGAIVMGGKIWHGMSGMAGEFGHVTLEPEGPPCGCGSRGCAERFASASGIMRMAREAVDEGCAPALAEAATLEAQAGPKAIYDLARQGDPQAQRIFRTFGRYLGIMLAGAINVLDLEMYVIGGGVCGAWDEFAPTMFEELRRRSVVYAATTPTDPIIERSSSNRNLNEKCESGCGQTIITRALLGSDAGLLGAAHAAVMDMSSVF